MYVCFPKSAGSPALGLGLFDQNTTDGLMYFIIELRRNREREKNPLVITNILTKKNILSFKPKDLEVDFIPWILLLIFVYSLHKDLKKNRFPPIHTQVKVLAG